jgi:hypothetical protein
MQQRIPLNPHVVCLVAGQRLFKTITAPRGALLSGIPLPLAAGLISTTPFPSTQSLPSVSALLPCGCPVPLCNAVVQEAKAGLFLPLFFL